MKLIRVIFLAILFHVVAIGYAQNVTLAEHNVPFEHVIKEIARQTGSNFMYNTQMLREANPIDIHLDNSSLKEALDKTFAGQPLTYTLRENTIVVKRKEQERDPIVIRGKVSAEDGSTIPGVTILVKGTTRGTVTDEQGHYAIRVLEGDEALVFSCVGRQTREVFIEGREVINVLMQENITELSQVVVTGYSTVDRRTYTGAATTITAADLIRVSSGNVLQTLQTIDPSFAVIEDNLMGSNPNTMPEIQLRGEGSLPGLASEFQYNPNMPTFILDGFEVPARIVFDLDPNRVESITILKDAAASAIYGSRAANGVVVIETKVPARGRLRVNYKNDVKFSGADLSDYSLLNAEEKLEYELLAGVYPGSPTSTVWTRERNMDEFYQKQRLVAMGYDTDWLAQPVNTVAVAHKHSLQIEEGTENFRYSLNLFYDNDNGVMKESYRDRVGVGAYFQYRYKNLLFMNNLTYNQVSAANSPYGSFSQYAQVNPYLPFEDANGEVVKYFDFVNTSNPMYNAGIGVIDREAIDEVINNFQLEWTIVEGLRLRNSAAFRKTSNRNELFLPADHTSFRSLFDSNSAEAKALAGTYRNDYGEDFRFDASSVLNYFKYFNEHLITINTGVNMVTQRGDINVFQVRGFPSELLSHPSFGTSYDMQPGTYGVTPGGSDDISRMIGVLGAANYTWKNRYFTDISGRLDGSSKFGGNNRWAKLWSVGIGWNVHEEAFLKDSKLISMLRLRASTGFTGSQNYNPNQALTMFDYIRGDFYFWSLPGASLTAMGNENLKWQRTRKHNIGVDLQLFNKRVSASGNFYIDDSMDALTQVSLPPSLGFNSYTENLGQVRNKGYEFNFSVIAISRPQENFYWTLFANAAHNKNTLMKISNFLDAWNAQQDAQVSSNPKVRFEEGQDMNAIWVVPSLGIDPATGQEIFLTKDGELTNVWNPEDQVVAGTTTPDLFGSFGTQLTLDRWQINVYMLYSYGGAAYNQTLVNRVENANPNFNVDSRVFLDRWREPGDVSHFKNIASLTTTQPTSRFIEDNNYLRLTSFSLQYEFDRSKIEKLRLQQLRFILYANDVFNISSVKQERGLNYPFARSFTFTTQISF